MLQNPNLILIQSIVVLMKKLCVIFRHQNNNYNKVHWKLFQSINISLLVYKNFLKIYGLDFGEISLRSEKLDLVTLSYRGPGRLSPGLFSPGHFSPRCFSPGRFSPRRFSPGCFSPRCFSPGQKSGRPFCWFVNKSNFANVPLHEFLILVHRISFLVIGNNIQLSLTLHI